VRVRIVAPSLLSGAAYASPAVDIAGNERDAAGSATAPARLS